VLTLSNDICTDVRIGLGSVAPTAIRARKAEDIMKGQAITDEIVKKAAEAAAGEARPIDDIRAYAQYRVLALKASVERAISEAIKDAKWGGA
ncbi:MAG: xanthine dehydrogenase family protein subunit M, partial [Candidatus Aureabacteria bacterium]|nr:xanthine dehydrogenase family protein subunit M [Candidatus Auribacterota bacterium]